MTDGDFLRWVHDRFVYVIGDSPNLDYVQKINEVASRVDELTRQRDDAERRAAKWLQVSAAVEVQRQRAVTQRNDARRIAIDSGAFQDHRGTDYDIPRDLPGPLGLTDAESDAFMQALEQQQ